MSTPRFFYPSPLHPDSRIELPDTLAHHALRVLRLQEGAAITLFNGTGGQYGARLFTKGQHVMADIGPHEPVECELQGTLELVQGIAWGDKMDWVVEKAVELGVAALHPVAADRSVLKLRGPRLDKRLAHWRAIVRSASEQCGRNRLMRIHEPVPLRDCLARLEGPTLFCHPEGEQEFHRALSQVEHHLNLMIGPEGGWSEAELSLAQNRGLRGVQFGKRVLRTETAGLAMAAAATALLGW